MRLTNINFLKKMICIKKIIQRDRQENGRMSIYELLDLLRMIYSSLQKGSYKKIIIFTKILIIRDIFWPSQEYSLG